MAKESDITQKDFELLLNWLDKDRDIAARKYESIHRRLVQIFLARKAYPAEELADRTMDVVLQKIDSLVKEYEGDPNLYFYSVAYKIFHESLREPKPEQINDQIAKKAIVEEKASNPYIECLNECLRGLSPEKREIFTAYFRHEKGKKIKNHKKMAKKLQLDLTALRTRVYRIRKDLESCVRSCVQKKYCDVLPKNDIYK